MARVIFDLDGTLVHSAPSLASASNALLAELGRSPLSLETVIGFVGNGAPKLVERVLQISGGIPQGGFAASLDRFKEIYFADPLKETVAFPFAQEALNAISRNGHGLGVCTQKPNAPGLEVLHALDMMPPITAFTGGDSLDVLKPDPAMLRHTAAQLPDGPIVFVGDSKTDAETAKAAGVPFLLHANGYANEPLESLAAAAIFDNFQDLPGLVKDVLAQRATG
ncbi:MAG: phosphoglycolate phosphatase [Pseudomonadota bacterium]